MSHRHRPADRGRRPRARARRRAHQRRRRRHAPAVARPRGGRARGERDPQPQDRPESRHVHRRPEHQLHERLRHRLRLLRVLPQPRRHARGLPAAEACDLQEDRGDARDRRYRCAHAGRPSPRSRDRVLRGPVQLDQEPLHDPPALPFAARDPAHLPAVEADRLGNALAPARRGPRLAAGRRRRDPRRPCSRHHRAEEDELGRVAGRDAARAPARHVDDRDHDVRPRRDARGARRAHAPRPRGAGRDGRLPGVHLLDVPAGRQPPRRHRPRRGHADLVRLPAHAGRLADLPRQRRRTSSRRGSPRA